jgi:teichoic acid transport system permease protein
MWVAEDALVNHQTLKKILMLNPMYYIVSGYRDAFVMKRWFFEQPGWTLYFWVFTLLMFMFGNGVFKRLRVHFADVL